MLLPKNRRVDQWSRGQDPDINHSYSHATFYKDAKNIHWSKDSPFNKGSWGMMPLCGRMKQGPYLISSKWTKC